MDKQLLKQSFTKLAATLPENKLVNILTEYEDPFQSFEVRPRILVDYSENYCMIYDLDRYNMTRYVKTKEIKKDGYFTTVIPTTNNTFIYNTNKDRNIYLMNIDQERSELLYEMIPNFRDQKHEGENKLYYINNFIMYIVGTEKISMNVIVVVLKYSNNTLSEHTRIVIEGVNYAMKAPVIDKFNDGMIIISRDTQQYLIYQFTSSGVVNIPLKLPKNVAMYRMISHDKFVSTYPANVYRLQKSKNKYTAVLIQELDQSVIDTKDNIITTNDSSYTTKYWYYTGKGYYSATPKVDMKLTVGRGELKILSNSFLASGTNHNKIAYLWIRGRWNFRFFYAIDAEYDRITLLRPGEKEIERHRKLLNIPINVNLKDVIMRFL